jgi:beta-xylosidase
MFNSSTLSPNWSFLEYTLNNTYSLTERQGWLYLKPYSGANTVIQNDGEHNFTLITRVDFQSQATTDEAGLWIINGPETLNAKVFCTVNSAGAKTLAFSYNTTSDQIENPLDSIDG